jgi:hypothetical protein
MRALLALLEQPTYLLVDGDGEANVDLLVCGHVGGEGRRVDRAAHSFFELSWPLPRDD